LHRSAERRPDNKPLQWTGSASRVLVKWKSVGAVPAIERWPVMRQKRRLILRVACCASVALCALVLLQSAGIVRTLGAGWGDGTRARAYSIEVEGPIVLRTASGMKPAPPGKYEYAVQSLSRSDAFGASYHRWNMTAGRAPQAPVLGTFAQVRIATGWSVALSLMLVGLCVMSSVKQRRLDRSGHHCRNCGYDLRATPGRCPECGLVPAAPPAV